MRPVGFGIYDMLLYFPGEIYSSFYQYKRLKGRVMVKLGADFDQIRSLPGKRSLLEHVNTNPK